jgi:hypothetical protein
MCRFDVFFLRFKRVKNIQIRFQWVCVFCDIERFEKSGRAAALGPSAQVFCRDGNYKLLLRCGHLRRAKGSRLVNKLENF